MPSKNNLIIKTLTNTFQSGYLDPAKTYDLVNRMNQDLNEVFNAVFDGPLPAVSGFNLTSLNAANLVGPIPESYHLAYTDRVNSFSRGQEIVQDDEEEPFLKFGFGDLVSDPVVTPSSYFRIGSIGDGDFFISQNSFWDGSVFDRDDATIGAVRVDLINGDLAFNWYDTVLGDFRDTWSFSGKDILCSNFDDDDVLAFALLDEEDVFRLGESAAIDNTPKGWIAIPAKVFTELPAAGPESDGIIGINKTSNRFVFYHSGLRYYVTGTSF